MPKAIIFDLDGTLAISKSPLEAQMGELLKELLARIPVALTSGASQTQFLEQVVDRLPLRTNLQNLYLLPTSGSALYTFDGHTWRQIYAETLTEKEMAEAESSIERALELTKIQLPEAYGPRVERRHGTQVAFSAAGQKAPIEVKRAWDPDQKKRRALVEIIRPELPWAEVKIGGTTTIDITRRGVNKRYGLEQLSRRLRIPIKDMLYVGDALYPHGNDEVVIDSGIQTKQVQDPTETAKLIESLLTHA